MTARLRGKHQGNEQMESGLSHGGKCTSPCKRPFRVNRKTILPRLQSKEMSDALYLSLWYPNLRLAALPDKLVAVLSEFARHGGEPLVYSATVWPVSWSESPVFQQVYGRRCGRSRRGRKNGSRTARGG